MRKKRLLWILYPPYLIVVLLTMIAIGSYTSRSMKQLYLRHVITDLKVRMDLIVRRLPDTFPDTPADSLSLFTRENAALSAMGITLVTPASRLIADSDEDIRNYETVAHRTEVIAALSGKVGVERRQTPGSAAEVQYVAIPIWREDKVVGALRAAYSLTALTPDLRLLNLHMMIGGAVIALLAALVTWIISRWIARPIAEMVRGAERFAAGDFSRKMGVPESDELGGLAVALNNMAEQLDEKIRTITVQNSEQEAILTSLREGVIALDIHERLLFVNRAAANLLGMDAERAIGRLLQEVVRHSELQKFILHLLSGHPVFAESEITLVHGDSPVLQVTGTLLRDSKGEQFGVVVVMNDITRLRRLERVRKDFVANVSHELKTPITSIKGFVETLYEGAMEDRQSAKAFLDRIAINTERLNSIIDDLLMLSRIEQESDQGAIPLEPGSLREIVNGALASVEYKAQARGVELKADVPQDIIMGVNSTLLEQAVVNLLDNAIKYSEPGRSVKVSVEQRNGMATIRVKDEGVGIAPEHLPRIFERFYRVDKARSRKLGGTGLGLAIVKHIAQAHGGTVAVESTLGNGTTFTIELPGS